MSPTSERVATLNQYIQTFLIPKYFPQRIAKLPVDPMEAYFKIRFAAEGKHFTLAKAENIESAEIVIRPMAEQIFILYGASADELESVNAMLKKDKRICIHYGGTMVSWKNGVLAQTAMTRKQFMVANGI